MNSICAREKYCRYTPLNANNSNCEKEKGTLTLFLGCPLFLTTTLLIAKVIYKDTGRLDTNKVSHHAERGKWC